VTVHVPSVGFSASTQLNKQSMRTAKTTGMRFSGTVHSSAWNMVDRMLEQIERDFPNGFVNGNREHGYAGGKTFSFSQTPSGCKWIVQISRGDYMISSNGQSLHLRNRSTGQCGPFGKEENLTSDEFERAFNLLKDKGINRL